MMEKQLPGRCLAAEYPFFNIMKQKTCRNKILISTPGDGTAKAACAPQ
jgi:hypothetical protein